jgi:hypothetical protein
MKIQSLASLALATAFAAGVALAQTAVPPPPPLPPQGAAPPPLAGDPELEPQVTIIRRDTETVEEVRINGELKFVRVTPLHGRPYYLVPDPNGFQFIRRDSLDTGLKVPLWVLFSW